MARLWQRVRGWLLRPERLSAVGQQAASGWRNRPLVGPSEDAVWLYAAGHYADQLSEQIRRAKYAGHWPSVNALRQRLRGALRSGLWPLKPILVPMPADPHRLGQRGFHLPVELAKGLSALTGCPMDRTGLVKRDHTPEQASLGRVARLANLTNTLRASPRLRGRRVVVVDDVVTTGASLAAARQALEAVGAEVLGAVVLADAGPRSSKIGGCRHPRHRPSSPRPRPKQTTSQPGAPG